MGRVHLERALSKLGIASRTQTRRLIEEGRLAVNGQVIRDPDFLIVPEKARFAIDGKAVGAAQTRTILFYKPRGIVTTRSDEKNRKTIYDLLPDDLRRLHPVGRLDMATTGLLIMTNDTKLSNFLTDPSNEIPRVYAVTVKGRISGDKTALLRRGIRDKDELLKPQSLSVRKTSGKESHLTVTLAEGKNREIRRLFEAVGHEVTALKRIAFGRLTLGKLQPGEFREISHKDIW